MQLEPYIIPSKDFIFSSKSSSCFTIDVSLRSKYFKAFVLLDLRASICFLDKKFVKRYSILLLKETKFVHVKVIDGCLLSSRDVIHEILLIEIATNGHNNLIRFEIIKSSSILTILDLL